MQQNGIGSNCVCFGGILDHCDSALLRMVVRVLRVWTLLSEGTAEGVGIVGSDYACSEHCGNGCRNT